MSWKATGIIFIILFLISLGVIAGLAAYYGGIGIPSFASKPVWSAPIGPGLDGSGNTVTYQRCDNWGGTNPGVCQTNAPTTMVGWEACAIGSSPGGLDPNNKFTACSPYSTTFSCLDAQNCYGFSNFTPASSTSSTTGVNATGPFTGVDSNGNTVTSQGCPNVTTLSNCKLPSGVTTQGWAVCPTGSSPGGADPNNSGTSCLPSYAPVSTTTCTTGNNCYAITNIVAKQ